MCKKFTLFCLFFGFGSLFAQYCFKIEQLWAFCYGISNFEERAIFLDGREGEKIKFAWIFYALRYPTGWVLIDPGFSDPYFIKVFEIKWINPLTLLAEIGIKPEDIKTLIITHGHFDHASNAIFFPNAKIVISQKAYLDVLNNCRLKEEKDFWLKAKNRLILFTGSYCLNPDLTVIEIGGHAPGSAILILGESKIIFSGDEAYLNENWNNNRPNGTFFNSKANQDFLNNLSVLKKNYIIYTMHDPKIIGREGKVLKLR